MQQATVNLFADMGVQPLTIQAGLVAATPSTDTFAPTSTITSPANGAAVPANTTVAISGTAADAGGGVVGGVEVSVDGGTTWRRADGTRELDLLLADRRTANGHPLQPRASTTAATSNSRSPAVTVTVGSTAAMCPCSLWHPSTDSDRRRRYRHQRRSNSGTRFRSDVGGFVTAIRFYKNAQNTGPHTGSLWTSTRHAARQRSRSRGESASGWQEADVVQPGGDHREHDLRRLVSHQRRLLHRRRTDTSRATGVDNGPLHAPRDGTFGANGVYRVRRERVPESDLRERKLLGRRRLRHVDWTGHDPADRQRQSLRLPERAASPSLPRSTATFNESMSAATITERDVRAPRLRDNALVAVDRQLLVRDANGDAAAAAALAYSTTYTARVVSGGGTASKTRPATRWRPTSRGRSRPPAPPPPPPTTGRAADPRRVVSRQSASAGTTRKFCALKG